MIKTQIIKENDRPVAVILDYDEYLRLKECKQELDDYNRGSVTKQKTRKWTGHEELKKQLKVK
ncbi:MAG: hypothetical protein PHQ23_16935 [Candidatus Wallbacteria bacterium]|nr:hypothetical protein [Candidatus Wallbacteria bacterium]